MFASERWASFLRVRGVDVSGATVSRLAGGEVNDNWRIDVGDRSWVLRHYTVTSDPAELDCELAAVDTLANAGFPTPAAIPATGADGRHRLWEHVDGRPAALFSFVPGVHPPQREGGYGSMDLTLGRKAARLAARMHRVLDGRRLPGARRAERDPWRQIGSFLSGPLAGDELFAQLVSPLRELHARLRDLYTTSDDLLPSGLIHNDITPPNLLLDDSGEVVALIDFDDCAQTFLAYELGSIVSVFGKDEHRRVDLDRIVALIDAYQSMRELTTDERTLLPDLLAAHAAAQGIHVLTNWLTAGRVVDDPMDSYSAQQFLDLVGSRSALHRRLGV